jgi:hypothetical protein
MASEDPAVGAGVPQPIGTRWFRKAGGMPPAMFGVSARCPADICRLRSGKRSRFLARWGAPCERSLAGSGVQRRRSPGSCGATPPSEAAAWSIAGQQGNGTPSELLVDDRLNPPNTRPLSSATAADRRAPVVGSVGDVYDSVRELLRDAGMRASRPASVQDPGRGADRGVRVRRGLLAHRSLNDRQFNPEALARADVIWWAPQLTRRESGSIPDLVSLPLLRSFYFLAPLTGSLTASTVTNSTL